MEEIKLYTPEEAAEILHMSIDYVYDKVQEGSLGCFRFGRKIRFSIDHLTSFIESKEEKPNDESD